jgi:hypothetical protein
MLPFKHPLVALNSKIAPGGFSGERIFVVKLANGEEYRGLAPYQFCWNSQGRLVDEFEPNSEVDGNVAARIVDYIDNEQVIVEVPDGQNIAVMQQTVIERPSNIIPPIYSGTYVPV